MDSEFINTVFDELNRRGQSRGRSDFSTEWLGREESYFRSIQSRGHKPSVEAQLNLTARLRDLENALENSDHPKIAATGRAYLKLSKQLLEALLDRTAPKAGNEGISLVQS